MTLTRELETLFFILLASAIGLFAVFYLRQPKHFQNVQVTVPLPHFAATISPSPTTTPLQPTVTSVSWTSSDGVEKITLQTSILPSSSTYAFTLTNTSTNVTTPLFTQTLPSGSTMSIPFNAFSSDNSYLYLKEITGGENHYLVFKTSGQPFADGKQYFDAAPLFSAYTSSLTLSDVIGWASPTLLILTTKKSDGSVGTTYWLDVTSKGIIPLSTVFQ